MWLNKKSVDMMTLCVEPLKLLSAHSCFYVLIEKNWSLNICCLKDDAGHLNVIEIKLFHFLFYLCWYGAKVHAQ